MSIGLPVDQSTTFKVCPNELQVKLIKHLPTWDSHKYLQRTIWSDINSPIMMGYCTHACKMPITNAKEIVDCINLFRGVFLRKPIDEAMRVYWVNWLQSISRVFFIPSKPASEELKTHKEIVDLVVGIFASFVVDMHASLDSNQWSTIQRLLVDAVFELLTANNYDCTQVQTISEVTCEPLVDVMLISFIGSPETSEDLWAYLRDKFGLLLGWKGVVQQWQEKILVLTDLVVQTLYSSGAPVPAGRKSIRRDTTFAASIGERATSSKDTRISSLEWTPESLRAMWFHVLGVLGSPVKITTGELFQTALGCVSQMLDMLIQAELDFCGPDNRPCIDVFEVFCPMLFESTCVDSKRGRGAIVAHSLLCEMFLQMRDRAFDPNLVAHFYRTLVSGLTGGHSAIAWAVIRNCRAIFWLNLPGCEVLIPTLLDQVENTFGAKAIKNPPPEKVQSRFLSLLAAMICYFQHFRGVSPDDADFDRVIDAFVLISEFQKGILYMVLLSFCSFFPPLPSCCSEISELCNQRYCLLYFSRNVGQAATGCDLEMSISDSQSCCA